MAIKPGLKILAVVVVLLLVAVFSAPWWFNFNHLRGPIASAVYSATGRTAQIGHINFDMGWTPKLTVDGITLANADWAEHKNMVQVDHFTVSLRLKRLLHGNIELPELIIDSPRINLARNAKGEANWVLGAQEDKQEEPSKQRASLPILDHIQIKNAEIVYADATRDFHFVANIKNFEGNAGGTTPLAADANGQLQGEPFSLKLKAGSMLALQNDDKPYPVDLDVLIGKTHGAFKGSIDRPLALRGLDIDMHIQGPNLEALFPVLGVPLPATPPYKLAGQLQHRGTVWGFKGFDGQVGDSDLAGDFNVDVGGKRLKINADLTSNKLDFDDLAPIIGAPPDTSETTSAKQDKKAEKVTESDKAIPDTKFNLDKLQSADANVKFKAKHIDAPDLPLDDLNLDLSLKNGLLKLKPLQFGIAEGTMDAYATIDASNPVITWDYDVRMRHFRLGKILKSASLKDAGRGQISGDIKLKARGNSPAKILADANGRVTLVMSGGQFSNLLLELAGADIAESLEFLATKDKKVPIRCMVADIDLSDGIMQSRELVFDTEDTRINGDLMANLKDETFTLRLEPEPKGPSILSVRTPVNISGTFKNIGVQPDYKSLGLRAGAAVLLGVFATPAAAVLAFVDPGLGKDAQCTGLLEETNTELPVAKPTK